MLSPARARFCTENADAAWPDASAERRHAALDRRDALLERILRRVHDAGVDVAEFLQAEQVRRVFRAVELVGGGLIDRHRDGIGRRIAPPAGVQHQRFRMLRLVRHGLLPL